MSAVVLSLLADKCVNRGASTVVIAPYFLSKGRHIQDDIPALVKEAQAKYPGVKCIIADPIGAHWSRASCLEGALPRACMHACGVLENRWPQAVTGSVPKPCTA